MSISSQLSQSPIINLQYIITNYCYLNNYYQPSLYRVNHHYISLSLLSFTIIHYNYVSSSLITTVKHIINISPISRGGANLVLLHGWNDIYVYIVDVELSSMNFSRDFESPHQKSLLRLWSHVTIIETPYLLVPSWCLQGESTHYNRQVDDIEWEGNFHFFGFIFSSLVGNLDALKIIFLNSPLTTMTLYKSYNMSHLM